MWDPENIPWDEYDALIRKMLKPSRYKRSRCVMERAVELAEKNGADVIKAKLAGLLHDIMKNVPEKEMLQFIEDSGIILLYADLCAPQLWHAIAGAAYLKEKLGIDDPDVINAVRYHTTGRAGMSKLEKVVYLADLTSADRDYPDVEQMREACRESTEQGMRYSLRYTVSMLSDGGRPINRDTWEAYNQAFACPTP